MAISAQYSYVNGLCALGEANSQYDYIVPGFIDIHCHGGGGKYFADGAMTAISTRSEEPRLNSSHVSESRMPSSA